MQYKKIFITGGAGFIGSNFCNYLVRTTKASITVYDNLSVGKLDYILPFIDAGRVKLVEKDLLDFDSLIKHQSGHDLVIHLSANADIALSATDTFIDMKQTVLATYNVLEAMKINGISRIVYSSGSGVYGDLGDYDPNETYGPLYPVSMYGATKLSAEAIISAFSALFSIQASIFRFANVVGPNQTHGVGYDFIKKLQSNHEMLQVLGDGMQSKSYIHVSDIISAVMTVIESQEILVDTFNVGTGDYVTVRDIAKIVTSEMGFSEIPIIYGDTPYGWKGDVPKVRFATHKIESLGWKPKFNSGQAIRESIKQMLGNT